MKTAVLAVTFLAALAAGQNLEGPDKGDVLPRAADTGNWKVGDCILAAFSMKFKLHVNSTQMKIKTTEFEVPTGAVSDEDQANCEANTNTLKLTWSEQAKNDTATTLGRTITFTFQKAQNTTSPMYGMTKFVAVFELAKFKNPGSENTTTSTVEMIHQVPKGQLVFPTPVDRSYTCKDINNGRPVTLNTTLRFDNVLATGLNATDMTATNVALDAFRPKTSPSSFRTPMDCDYKPNDIIPIAVGVALASLVVAVLVAYIVGRNRQRQRGYQSV